MTPTEALIILKKAMRLHDMDETACELETAPSATRVLTRANAKALEKAGVKRRNYRNPETLAEARILDAIARCCDDVGDAIRAEERGDSALAYDRASVAIWRFGLKVKLG